MGINNPIFSVCHGSRVEAESLDDARDTNTSGFSARGRNSRLRFSCSRTWRISRQIPLRLIGRTARGTKAACCRASKARPAGARWRNDRAWRQRSSTMRALSSCDQARGRPVPVINSSRRIAFGSSLSSYVCTSRSLSETKAPQIVQKNRNVGSKLRLRRTARTDLRGTEFMELRAQVGTALPSCSGAGEGEFDLIQSWRRSVQMSGDQKGRTSIHTSRRTAHEISCPRVA
jgi:hypothetical protein